METYPEEHMQELTSDIVTDIWAKMAKAHSAKLFSKESKLEMRIIATALATMGIVDEQAFLKKYTTTLMRRIYLPFALGTSDVSYLSQVRLCAHEFQHIVQFQRWGLDFMAKYLRSSAKRAAYECEALRAGMEVHFFLTSGMQDPHRLALKLEAYACSPDDILFAEKNLEMSANFIQAGGISTEAAKEVLNLLSDHNVIALPKRF